jgi:hypothetical protein
VSAVAASLPAGRHDAQARRKAQRRGRERGCWVYISAEQLGKAGLASDAFVPWYRVWGGQRGRYVVVLYSEA